MNAKEYLEQIRELEHKIYCMKLRSEYYDKMSPSIPGPTNGEKIGSNPNRNTEAPFMKLLFKKDEIDCEIIKLVEKLNSLKAEANVKIEALEKCGAVGTEAHHIVHLTNDNVDDPNISINLDNLILFCKVCHNKIHGLFEGNRTYEFEKDGNLIQIKKINIHML